jgi:hypothetical protein
LDHKKQNRLEQEPIESVDFGKAFHVSDRRNQWVDWNGTTAITRRPWGLLLSLSDAKDWAESSRLQGTNFIIDELPVVCAKSKSGGLLFSERRSAHPMSWYPSISSSFSEIQSIGALKALLSSKARSGIHVLVAAPVTVLPTDGVYYSRESSPGTGGNHLGWTLKP